MELAAAVRSIQMEEFSGHSSPSDGEADKNRDKGEHRNASWEQIRVRVAASKGNRPSKIANCEAVQQECDYCCRQGEAKLGLNS